MTPIRKQRTPITLGLVMAALALTMSARAAEMAPTPIQYRQDDRGYRQDDYRNQRQDDDRRGGGDVPGGSYLRSCGDARREGSTLVAVCRGRHGARFETSIDLSRCGRSDIGNNDGNLQCGHNRGGSRRVE